MAAGLMALLSVWLGFAGGASAAGGAPAPRAGVRLDVLGIHIGMKEAEAQRRLAPLGTRRELENEAAETAGAETLERELWTLRATDFGFVALGIGEEGRVEAVQAYVRPGRRPLRYREIGSLADARKLGTYIFLWVVPERAGLPGLRVEARGTNPEFLGSYSIVRDRAPAGPAGRREALTQPEGTDRRDRDGDVTL